MRISDWSSDACSSDLGSQVVRVADDMPAVVRIEDDAGSDRLTLRVRGSDAAGQALLIATLDNLGKGAAGAAVQNLHIMPGLEPQAGRPDGQRGGSRKSGGGRVEIVGWT